MKRDDRIAIHDKSVAELEKELSQVKTEWTKAKLKKSAGKSENPAEVRTLADKVAAIKTVIREKELAEQAANAVEAMQPATGE